jgi:hypothetical protein
MLLAARRGAVDVDHVLAGTGVTAAEIETAGSQTIPFVWSLRGDIVFTFLFAYQSPASKIPFQTRIGHDVAASNASRGVCSSCIHPVALAATCDHSAHIQLRGNKLGHTAFKFQRDLFAE